VIAWARRRAQPYGKKDVRNLSDLKAQGRVQATATEDAMFAAYGAQTVHIPSQRLHLTPEGVSIRENSVNVTHQRHYEWRRAFDFGARANNAILWISDAAKPHATRRMGAPPAGFSTMSREGFRARERSAGEDQVHRIKVSHHEIRIPEIATRTGQVARIGPTPTDQDADFVHQLISVPR